MDADHRHELKTNELTDWLSHLPEFIKKYANQIIGIILIIAGLISFGVFHQKKKAGLIQEQSEIVSYIDSVERSRYQTAQGEPIAPEKSLRILATSLGEQADLTENVNLAALALIKKADALRADLHFQENPTDEVISERISEARTAYEKALEIVNKPLLKALAEMGLGLCAEEVGEYDKARKIYEKVVAIEDNTAIVAIEHAKRRLNKLEDNSKPVFFVKAPEPEPQIVPPQEGIGAGPAIPALESLEAPTETAPVKPVEIPETETP